jgi:hypothetical protein
MGGSRSGSHNGPVDTTRRSLHLDSAGADRTTNRFLEERDTTAGVRNY